MSIFNIKQHNGLFLYSLKNWKQITQKPPAFKLQMAASDFYAKVTNFIP